MATCVMVTPDGYLSPVVPPPANIHECALVVQSGAEYASAFSFSALSVEDIGLLSWLVVGAWATAWGFKQIIRALNTAEPVRAGEAD